MLKKLMKSIRRQLLKIDWIKHEVEAYQAEQIKKRDNLLFAKFIHVGGAARSVKTSRPSDDDTLMAVDDCGMAEEYRNGKVVKRGYIDSMNW